MGFGLIVEMPEVEGEPSDPAERRRQYRFEAPQITIGRHSSNDLHLPFHAVSSKHAQIMREGDVYYLVDRGSTNGTWLNGERLAHNRKYPLEDADIISITNIRCIFVGEGAIERAEELDKARAESGADSPAEASASPESPADGGGAQGGEETSDAAVLASLGEPPGRSVEVIVAFSVAGVLAVLALAVLILLVI